MEKAANKHEGKAAAPALPLLAESEIPPCPAVKPPAPLRPSRGQVVLAVAYLTKGDREKGVGLTELTAHIYPGLQKPFRSPEYNRIYGQVRQALDREELVSKRLRGGGPMLISLPKITFFDLHRRFSREKFIMGRIKGASLRTIEAWAKRYDDLLGEADIRSITFWMLIKALGGRKAYGNKRPLAKATIWRDARLIWQTFQWGIGQRLLKENPCVPVVFITLGLPLPEEVSQALAALMPSPQEVKIVLAEWEKEHRRAIISGRITLADEVAPPGGPIHFGDHRCVGLGPVARAILERPDLLELSALPAPKKKGFFRRLFGFLKPGRA